MVTRTVITFDNQALTITSDSPSGTAGNPIVNNSDTPNGTIFEFQSGFPAATVTIDDTDGPNTFDDDDSGDHEIIDGDGLIATGTSVEAESVIQLRALDALGNQTGPTINVTVFSQNGQFFNIWGFGTDTFLSPGTRYVKTSGSNSGDSNYADFAVCFAEGTGLRAAEGHQIAVEDLSPGDRLWTEDDPACPVFRVAENQGAGRGARAPVEIAKGALGNSQTVRVSPQHRILFAGPEAELMFGETRLLVPAIHLVGLPGIVRAPVAEITYYHVIFDRHRIVDSGGLLSESFYPGARGVAHLDGPTQREVEAMFPGFSEDAPPPIAPTLKAHEGRMLAGAVLRRARG